MIILGILGIVLIVGIAVVVYGNVYADWYDKDEYDILGTILITLSSIFIVICCATILLKPISYKKFKVKYDTIKETVTYSDDIRDATFTNKIIEINEEILYCREFKDSLTIGIFQNKNICELELLSKGEE